jgi:hypothetical protein
VGNVIQIIAIQTTGLKNSLNFMPPGYMPDADVKLFRKKKTIA